MIYYKGYIYLIGGFGGQARLSEIDRYSLAAQEWHSVDYELWEGVENMQLFKGVSANEVLLLGGQTNHLFQNDKVMSLHLDQQTYQMDWQLRDIQDYQLTMCKASHHSRQNNHSILLFGGHDLSHCLLLEYTHNTHQ